uniref:WW domain-containing protein n=1 Tax=Oryza punctata TaxID=4537 RepID=A0A0E0K9W9_ORYPU
MSLQSALLLPEARRPRPPCLPLVDSVASTATSKKRKRGVDDDGHGESGEVGIELSFDAAPLPLEWQRCLDIKSGQIHYYNTRTHKRTSRDPRRAEAPPAPAPELHHRRAAPAEEEEEEETANYCAPPPGLDLELNLTFEPRRVPVQAETKKHRPATETTTKPAAAVAVENLALELPAGGASREMVAAVCTRCHMLVMMCREWPACPNCKFVHPTANQSSPPPPPPPPEPVPLKLGLQLLCCKD